MIPNQLQPIQNLLRKKREAGGLIAVLGIGSELRGDDAAGVLVARRIRELGRPLLCGLEGCTAPENFTGEIKQLNPAVVVVVDAADLGLPPGTVREIAPEQIGGMSFCTHTLPLSLIIDYLKQSLEAEFLVLGIQPATLEFHQEPSAAVACAIEQVVECLAE